MEDLCTILQQRQSCRNFAPRRVERAKLDACLHAAQLAPSACNGQPWRFVAVDDPQRVTQLAKCLQDSGMNRFTDGCPAFVVILEGAQNLTARFGGTLKNQQYAGIGIGLTTAHLVLGAAAQGLATCILGWFNERKLKMLLGVPGGHRIRLVVAIGYAAEGDPLREKQRKPFDELVSYNKF